MSTIVANVSKMFAYVHPAQCSASQTELGPHAGKITWDNVCGLAAEETLNPDIFTTPHAETAELMREYLAEYSLDCDRLTTYGKVELLAFFIQEIAFEVRTFLGADDDLDALEMARKYQNTDWAYAPESPRGVYYYKNGDLMVDFYTGV